MHLRLIREPTSANTTLGILLINGVFQCWTCEDALREVKIPGETCIPAGTYRITIARSMRFARPLPRLHDVPNFTDILIHPGNDASNTQGCILVGLSRGTTRIYNSQVACQAVTERLSAALAMGEVADITIENPQV